MSGVEIMWRSVVRASREAGVPGFKLVREPRWWRKGGEREERVDEEAVEMTSEVSTTDTKSLGLGVGVGGCQGSKSSLSIRRDFPLSSC